MKFGELIRSKRIEKQIGLRQFCIKMNQDPSNWSRIERGLLSPSLNMDFNLLAELLDCNAQALKDLAQLQKGKIPDSIKQNENLMQYIPAFICKGDGTKPTENELKQIIESIQNEIKKNAMEML